MSKAIVNIPALCPHPVGDPDSLGSYVASQPIMQLKELKVDQVRYDQWKAMIAVPKKERRKKKE